MDALSRTEAQPYQVPYGKTEKFDPFNDRRARMVRNQLSSAFIEGLVHADPELVDKRASALLQEYDHPLYRSYVRKRVRSYRQVYAALAIKPEAGSDVFVLTSLLWAHGLFFEVHELLEAHWGKATGNRRQALQGLIQAAGFYLLLEAGNKKGAVKLADKAVSNLADNREQLPKAMRLEELLSALKIRAAEPPRLL